MYYSFEYVHMKSMSMMRCWKMLTLTHGDKRAHHYIRYRVNFIFYSYFMKKNVAVQAQLLKFLLTLRKLKEATTLLGIRKSTKDKKK